MLTSTNRKFYTKVLLTVFLLISIFSIKAFSVVSPTKDFYVNDYANLLDTETKNYIINTNKSLCSQTGAKIVVVTVPNLEGNSLE